MIQSLRQPCPECHAQPRHLPECPVLVEYEHEQFVRTMRTAVEFGYRSCESGKNLEQTLIDFAKTLD